MVVHCFHWSSIWEDNEKYIRRIIQIQCCAMYPWWNLGHQSRLMEMSHLRVIVLFMIQTHYLCKGKKGPLMVYSFVVKWLETQMEITQDWKILIVLCQVFGHIEHVKIWASKRYELTGSENLITRNEAYLICGECLKTLLFSTQNCFLVPPRTENCTFRNMVYKSRTLDQCFCKVYEIKICITEVSIVIRCDQTPY